MTRLKLVNLLEALLRVDVPQIDAVVKENGVLILVLGTLSYISKNTLTFTLRFTLRKPPRI